jgi:capsular polysaccharide biosynthesis protein
MNLKNYFEVIKRRKVFIVSFGAICGILSLIFSLTTPKSYEAVILLSVHRVNREKTADFQYDNYYAIQAAEYVGNTIVSLLEMPETILEIYKKAGWQDEMGDVYAAARKIKPKQISSHLVKVKLNDKNKEKVERLSGALADVIRNKISSIEVTPENKNSFTVESTEPIITQKTYSPPIVTLIGFLGGIMIGMGFSFCLEYLKEEK